MADKRISQLIERTDIANNDVLPIVASGATTTNKVTISTIQTWMQDNLDVGVTSVGVNIGTTGTDINVTGSPVTSSGNITINLPTASATNRGALSSADWITFNAKQPAGNYVTLDTTQTITAQKTFTTSGSSDTMIISHGSGSGFALDVIKAGNGEAIRVTKTSGSGNAMTVVGANIEVLGNFVKTGGTSSQFLKADGSVDSSTYLTTGSAASTYLPLIGGTLTGTLEIGTSAPSIFMRGANSGLKSIQFANAGGSIHWSLQTSLGASGEQGTFSIRNNGLSNDAIVIQPASNNISLTGSLGGTSANFSGALNGTSASFTGNVSVNSASNAYHQVAVKSNGALSYQGVGIYSSSNDRFISINHTGTEGFIETENAGSGIMTPLSFKTGGVTRLTLASTGAATFSGSVTAGGQIALNSGFGTSTPAISIYNNTGASASNVALIDFRVNNTFGGNERVASISASNPNAAGNNGGQLNFLVSAYGTGTTPVTALSLASTGAATFSSSVTAGGNVLTPAGSGLAFTGDASRIITPEDNVSGALIQTPGIIRFNAGGTSTKMTITAAGNVGIGTPTPTVRLQAENTINSTYSSSDTLNGGVVAFIKNTSSTNSTDATIRLEATGSSNVAAASISAVHVGAGSSDLTFGTRLSAGNVTERMRITSGGFLKASNTGSYVSSTSSVHEIRSNIAGASLLVSNSNSSFPYGLAITYNQTPNNNAEFFIECVDSTTSRFIVSSNGNVRNTNNSYGAISDSKLKENITDASPKLDDLLKVKVRNYNLIGEETKQIGVIAQELEEVFPAMVSESEDFEEVEVPQLDEEGNEVLNEEGEVVTTKERISKGTTTKSVKYSVFVPMLIKAIQELKAEIDSLKTK